MLSVKDIKTPAYFFFEKPFLNDLALVQKARNNAGIDLLYAIKSCSLNKMIEHMAGEIDGFAASSMFEVMWIKELTNSQVHITSPSISLTTPCFHHEKEADYLMKNCTSISFNSLPEFKEYQHFQDEYDFKPYLRVNPQVSLVKNDLYNPCAPVSKLGVELDQLKDIKLKGLHGLHFHTNADGKTFDGLFETVQKLHKLIPHLLKESQSLNMGGGYLFREDSNLDPFYRAVDLIRKHYPDLCMFIEPGTSICQRSGNLEVTVMDIFQSGGKNVAIIDGSINSMPEVLEFRYHNKMLQEVENGEFEYLIGGTTCLQGDNWGFYKFDKPLKIGQRLRFIWAGAYTLVKNNWFNGIRIADTYWIKEDGIIEHIKKNTYEDFRRHWIG